LRFWVSLCAVFLLVCLVVGVLPVFAAGSEDAVAAVSSADGALRGAFLAVSGAEGSGANVSGLMGRLTEAGGALTGAKAALENGDYADAVSQAGECVSLASGVVEDAGVLKSDAVATASGWWITVSLSVVGSAVFVAVLFLAWRWFRRFYAAKLLGSRPEVVE
jgi:hypothetical protein